MIWDESWARTEIKEKLELSNTDRECGHVARFETRDIMLQIMICDIMLKNYGLCYHATDYEIVWQSKVSLIRASNYI